MWARSLGLTSGPLLVGLDGAHEGVRDQDAVVQVEGLAVGVAAGGAAHLDELLDLGMPDRQVDRGRAAAQRALADGERQAVHHADERDDAGGLAVAADVLADRAQVAPVGADAAALGGQPDVLVPEADDALQAVGGLVQEAGDRQAALGAAVGQHRGGGHEPVPGHVVVEALGMSGVVAVEAGDAGEQVLAALAGQQVAVVERGAAEVGQQGVAGAVDADRMAAGELHHVIQAEAVAERVTAARGGLRQHALAARLVRAPLALVRRRQAVRGIVKGHAVVSSEGRAGWSRGLGDANGPAASARHYPTYGIASPVRPQIYVSRRGEASRDRGGEL